MECAEYQELNALYALDALDAQGRQALEAHLATCPDCAKDLAALRDTAAAIGYTAPRVAVPTDLKTRLDARIAAESAPPKATVVSFARPQRTERTWQVAAAVLGVGLLASLVRQGALQHDLDATRTKNAELVAQMAVQHEQMASLGAKDVRVVSFSGQSMAPEASARLFWSPERKAWLLTIAGLPAAGPGKTYQLWAVTPNAKVPMGTFEPSAGGMAVVETKMDKPMKPMAAAISLEPAGGMPQPTGPIVMLGNL
jgi:anti-sigma-K factor RskA